MINKPIIEVLGTTNIVKVDPKTGNVVVPATQNNTLQIGEIGGGVSIAPITPPLQSTGKVVNVVSGTFIAPYMFKPGSLGYIIYNPKTQQFGNKRGMSKSPKVWNKLGHLKSHLNLILVPYPMNNIIKVNSTYNDCVIVDLATHMKVELDIKEYAKEVVKKKYFGNAHYADYAIVEVNEV